jgi:hypothetical protein
MRGDLVDDVRGSASGQREGRDRKQHHEQDREALRFEQDAPAPGATTRTFLALGPVQTGSGDVRQHLEITPRLAECAGPSGSVLLFHKLSTDPASRVRTGDSLVWSRSGSLLGNADGAALRAGGSASSVVSPSMAMWSQVSSRDGFRINRRIEGGGLWERPERRLGRIRSSTLLAMRAG